MGFSKSNRTPGGIYVVLMWFCSISLGKSVGERRQLTEVTEELSLKYCFTIANVVGPPLVYRLLDSRP